MKRPDKKDYNKWQDWARDMEAYCDELESKLASEPSEEDRDRWTSVNPQTIISALDYGTGEL